MKHTGSTAGYTVIEGAKADHFSLAAAKGPEQLSVFSRAHTHTLDNKEQKEVSKGKNETLCYGGVRQSLGDRAGSRWPALLRSGSHGKSPFRRRDTAE